MVLSKLRQVIALGGWRREGRLVGGRTQAVRTRGEGRGCAPHEAAQAGSAPPGSVSDDRGPPRPHGRRRRGAQPGAEETEPA
eukprot:6192897-Pleurochrysis_carterae.AAC.1